MYLTTWLQKNKKVNVQKEEIKEKKKFYFIFFFLKNGKKFKQKSLSTTLFFS